MTTRTEENIINAQRQILRATLEIVQAQCDFTIPEQQFIRLRVAVQILSDVSDSLDTLADDSAADS